MEAVSFGRGSVVTCAPPGEYGKPRPAVVMQSDLFNATHASVTVCPVTTYTIEAGLFRVPLRPAAANGLKAASEVMADKITTLRRERIGAVIGQLSPEELQKVEAAVLLWLGFRA